MDKKQLKEIVKKAWYLTERQRKEFLKLIPKMTDKQFSDFAKIIEWAEIQKRNLNFEKNVTLTGVAKMFTLLNIKAVEKAKKDAYKNFEKKQRVEENKKTDNLLKQINNE